MSNDNPPIPKVASNPRPMTPEEASAPKPTQEDRERSRILRLAYAAKCLAFHSGEPVPPDNVLIRAALAYDLHLRFDDPSLRVCLIAAQFVPDSRDPQERLDLLNTALPDPAVGLREMVAGNRRALGLPPQEDGEGPTGPACLQGPDDALASGVPDGGSEP